MRAWARETNGAAASAIEATSSSRRFIGPSSLRESSCGSLRLNVSYGSRKQAAWTSTPSVLQSCHRAACEEKSLPEMQGTSFAA
jgi:hypothetical protein